MNKIKQMITLLASMLIVFCAFADDRSTIAKTKDAEERFSYAISQTKELDREAKVQMYSSTSTFYDYERRFKKAKQILENLEKIEEDFKELSDLQKTEKDYYVKLAYVNLASLNIYSRKNDYLNYLKVSFQSNPSYYRDNKALFEDLSSKWEEKELYHLKSARQRVKLIQGYEENNIDALIINALIPYYEKQNDVAIKTINDLIALLQGGKMENKVENFSVEEKVCMLTTWVAYVQFEKGDLNAFKNTLKSVLAYNNPAENVIWAQECLKKLEASKSKSFELSIPALEFPKVAQSMEEVTFEIMYEKLKPVSAEVKSKTILIESKPEMLAQAANLGWKELSALENKPWKTAKQELDASVDNGKTLYKNKDNILIALDAKNKGYSAKNREEFITRLQSAIKIYNRFVYSVNGWSALSRLNPQIVYYRTNKIKADLGIWYLHKNKDTYLDILNYYKVDGKALPASKINAIKELFDKDPSSEILQDLNYLETNSPTNIYYLLVKAEVSMMLDEPAKALNTIEEVAAKIPDNASLPDMDPFVLLETYRSYVYFKQKDFSKLSVSIETLKSLGASSEWIQDLTARKDFLKKENDAISKGYK